MPARHAFSIERVVNDEFALENLVIRYTQRAENQAQSSVNLRTWKGLEFSIDRILEAFATKEGLSLDTELLTTSQDDCSVTVWLDPDLPNRFLKHHEKYQLRLVHRRENLSDIKVASGG